VGASATLLALLIGPMFQETVVHRAVWLPDAIHNATAPVSKLFAPPTNPELPKLDVGMKGTILNGLTSANTSSLTPSFSCPSGNCTYNAPYTSLGICHACQKVEVTRRCEDVKGSPVCNYTIPSGHLLHNLPSKFPGEFNFVNVSTAFNLSSKMAIAQNDVVDQFDLVRASIISLTNGPLCQTNGSNPVFTLINRDNATQSKLFGGGVIGAYCDLALCTNTYRADITDTVISEKTIASSDARNLSSPTYFTLVENEYDPVVLPNSCYINGEAYTLEEYKGSNNNSWEYTELFQSIGGGNLSSDTVKVPIDCVFAMRRVTYQSFTQFMSGNPFFLDSSGTSDSNTGVAGGLFSFYPNDPSLAQSFANLVFGIEPLFNNGNASFESIDASFGRLVVSSVMNTSLVHG
jgi:hypothetical protein